MQDLFSQFLPSRVNVLKFVLKWGKWEKINRASQHSNTHTNGFCLHPFSIVLYIGLNMIIVPLDMSSPSSQSHQQENNLNKSKHEPVV